jgi:hypothetical protein
VSAVQVVRRTTSVRNREKKKNTLIFMHVFTGKQTDTAIMKNGREVTMYRAFPALFIREISLLFLSLNIVYIPALDFFKLLDDELCHLI